MSFLSKENVYRLYRVAWWLCVVTLPWIDVANNASLILLTLLWLADGDFKIKWQRLKSSSWAWPFLFYYLLLLIGMVYTQDTDNGLFTLDKKISFFVLPLLAS